MDGWSERDPFTEKTRYHGSVGENQGYSKQDPITGKTYFHRASSVYLSSSGGGPIGPVSDHPTGLGSWWSISAWTSSANIAAAMFIPVLIFTLKNQDSAVVEPWGWWFLVSGPLMVSALWNVVITIIILVRSASDPKNYAPYRRFAIWSSIAWLGAVGVVTLLARAG